MLCSSTLTASNYTRAEVTTSRPIFLVETLLEEPYVCISSERFLEAIIETPLHLLKVNIWRAKRAGQSNGLCFLINDGRNLDSFNQISYIYKKNRQLNLEVIFLIFVNFPDLFSTVVSPDC